jgi:hypothetical protein
VTDVSDHSSSSSYLMCTSLTYDQLYRVWDSLPGSLYCFVVNLPPFDYGYDCLKELVLIIEDLSAILSWQLLPLIHANVYVFQLSMEVWKVDKYTQLIVYRKVIAI